MLSASFDAVGQFLVERSGGAVSDPASLESFGRRITHTGTADIFLALLHTNRRWLQDPSLTPRLYQDYLEYLLGEFVWVWVARDQHGHVVATLARSLVLAYEQDIPKETVRRVSRREGWATARRQARKDPTTTELFFTTPLALAGTAGPGAKRQQRGHHPRRPRTQVAPPRKQQRGKGLWQAQAEAHAGFPQVGLPCKDAGRTPHLVHVQALAAFTPMRAGSASRTTAFPVARAPRSRQQMTRPRPGGGGSTLLPRTVLRPNRTLPFHPPCRSPPCASYTCTRVPAASPASVTVFGFDPGDFPYASKARRWASSAGVAATILRGHRCAPLPQRSRGRSREPRGSLSGLRHTLAGTSRPWKRTPPFARRRMPPRVWRAPQPNRSAKSQGGQCAHRIHNRLADPASALLVRRPTPPRTPGGFGSTSRHGCFSCLHVEIPTLGRSQGCRGGH